METFDPNDILIKLDDGTKWFFMMYAEQAYDRFRDAIVATPTFVVVKPIGEPFNTDATQTLPAAQFKKASQENFSHGDIIILGGDGSKWSFKRYVIDKVTVSADWAEKNNWTGSSGIKTKLYAVLLAENGAETGPEKQFESRLFSKA